MHRRAWLISLVVAEALLWAVASGFPFFRFTSLSLFYVAVAGTILPLVVVLNIVALSIPVLIGALSRTWQSAVALNVIASLLTVILTLVVVHNNGIFSLIEGATAPLAALGWFGWLLRFVRAEFAA